MNTSNSHQPRALPYLFLTEMWERFGFYIVQGLLVLYMTEYFGFSDNQSYMIVGVFIAFVYISPLLGGYLANKFLGFKASVIYGGIFLVAGYALLALPNAHKFLHPALATIIVGNGLFKPNVSSLLGAQYETGDLRRDSGFTIFYIGINIGAFLAGLSAGYIKNYLGWRASFAVASLGLIIGILTFSFGWKYIKERAKNYTRRLPITLLILAGCIVCIFLLTYVLQVSALTDWLLPLVGILLLIYLSMLTSKQNAEDRKKMLLLNILTLSSVIFWTLFLQMFSSGNLFVERLVNKELWGIHLTTTFFWGSESIFIILLGPFFALTWHALGAHEKNPSPIIKFYLGIFFAGLGFALLALSTFFPDATNRVPALWVFGAYLLITIGELLLSPIGLSAVTMLAPQNLVGLMMGVWFVATGFGGIFSGLIAKLASIPDNVVSFTEQLAIYRHAFLVYACLAFLTTILLLLTQLSLRRFLKS